MKLIRIVFLSICAVMLLTCAGPLFASPEPAPICCNEREDCPSGFICCDFGFVDLDPCDPAAPGYCHLACVTR
jgi:hypothetical protein